jgi:DNA-directed RNA polymerase specialized sigma24 family protein
VSTRVITQIEMQELLKILTPQERAAVEQKIIYKKHHATTAKLLCVSHQRVSQVYRRAIKKLKRALFHPEPLTEHQIARQTTKRLARWLNEGHLAGIIR